MPGWFPGDSDEDLLWLGDGEVIPPLDEEEDDEEMYGLPSVHRKPGVSLCGLPT